MASKKADSRPVDDPVARPGAEIVDNQPACRPGSKRRHSRARVRKVPSSATELVAELAESEHEDQVEQSADPTKTPWALQRKRTPGLRSPAGARERRAIHNSTTVVGGGGVVRLAGGEYYAAALGRYDGRRVTVRPTANNAGLEVLLDGRLLCHARLIGPDEDTGSVPAFVAPSPHHGSGGAHLRLPVGFAPSCLASVRSGPRSAPVRVRDVRHHAGPRRPWSAGGHLFGRLAPSDQSNTTTTTVGVAVISWSPHCVTTRAANAPPVPGAAAHR
jgi:hypothetical protein